MKSEKEIYDLIERSKERVGEWKEILGLNLGIYYICLRKFDEARDWFSISLTHMFSPRPFWKGGGEPNLLVDVWMMSNQNKLFDKVNKEIEGYQKSRTIINPMGSYALCILGLSKSISTDFSPHINTLKKKPKYKDLYSIGNAIESILEMDEIGLQNSLYDLLKSHAGMAKHGALRESAEGLICLSAMSLGLAAQKRGMSLNIENEYFSMGYLNYLIGK